MRGPPPQIPYGDRQLGGWPAEAGLRRGRAARRMIRQRDRGAPEVQPDEAGKGAQPEQNQKANEPFHCGGMPWDRARVKKYLHLQSKLTFGRLCNRPVFRSHAMLSGSESPETEDAVDRVEAGEEP